LRLIFALGSIKGRVTLQGQSLPSIYASGPSAERLAFKEISQSARSIINQHYLFCVLICGKKKLFCRPYWNIPTTHQTAWVLLRIWTVHSDKGNKSRVQ